MSGGRRVAALFVNYNSGRYLSRAVSSLWAQTVDGAPAQAEVVVVDNASPKLDADRPTLERLRDDHGVTVVWNGENVGYGRGMNLALERTSARYVAAINPDVVFAPGALQALLDALDDPRAGAVGPRGYLDDDRQVFLPINQLPTLDDEMARFRGRFSARASLRHSLALARESHRVNRAEEPVEVGMLSGACVLMRRDTVERVGFFDPRFPLFYEDSDLCRRVRAAGLRNVYVPRAEMTHFVSRSVVSAPKSDDPMKRWARARALYFRKWYGPLGESLIATLDREAARHSRFSGKTATPCTSLGVIDVAPTFRFPRAVPEALLEIALDSGFFLAASAYGSGASWTFPPRAWDTFFSGADVFVRAIDVRDFSVLGTWTFTTRPEK